MRAFSGRREESELIVGITGNIGSGKSTLSKFLRLKGFSVYSADEIGKELLQTEAKDEVVRVFGKEPLTDSGLIDTKKLGSIVFSNPNLLSKLTEILHPLILERIDSLKREYSSSIVFLEAAVAVEYGWHRNFDSLILVFAYRGQRLLRAAKRFGLKEAVKRDSLQLPYSEKLKYADYLICNTTTLLYLKEQSELLIEEIAGC